MFRVVGYRGNAVATLGVVVDSLPVFASHSRTARGLGKLLQPCFGGAIEANGNGVCIHTVCRISQTMEMGRSGRAMVTNGLFFHVTDIERMTRRGVVEPPMRRWLSGVERDLRPAHERRKTLFRLV
jgi:hypothetical protein